MEYYLHLKTAPSVEPISVTNAKKYLRIDFADDDTYIGALIVAARKFCENYQRRAYITQVWEMTLNDWPDCVLEIPKGKLQSIDAITYVESDGTENILGVSNYVYSTRGIVGRLALAYGYTWPSFTPYPLEPIIIEFTCGYGDAATDVPDNIIQAMYILISHWYENRLPLGDKMYTSDEIVFSVSSLLWQERLAVM